MRTVDLEALKKSLESQTAEQLYDLRRELITKLTRNNTLSDPIPTEELETATATILWQLSLFDEAVRELTAYVTKLNDLILALLGHMDHEIELH